MSQDEFTKLFKYMQEQFRLIDRRFDLQHQDTDALRNSVDTYAKDVDDFVTELAMLIHSDSRQDKWISVLAAKTGVQLEY